MNYTEKQIREAFGTEDVPFLQGSGIRLSADELFRHLGKSTKPVWAESDTVTVKELREVWERWFPATLPGHEHSFRAFLQDIREHREPEYPPGSTWLDSGNPAVPWYRTGNGTWLKFGREGTFPDDAPVRPLKRMDVI